MAKVQPDYVSKLKKTLPPILVPVSDKPKFVRQISKVCEACDFECDNDVELQLHLASEAHLKAEQDTSGNVFNFRIPPKGTSSEHLRMCDK